MKKITHSLSLLLVVGLVLLSNFTQAQTVRRSSFRVDAPASIQGYKIITEIDSTSATSPWGTSIDSTWEGFPVKYDPANMNGCTAFAPGYFTGHFALIFRGGCEFGAKALAAQNAGARGVIIVNNLLGVAGMGAGASGGTVEIPVVMITTADGNAIKTQIDAAVPVNVSLTAWRYDPITNPIDIGYMNDSPVMPLGKCMPKHQTDGAIDDSFSVFVGAQIYNFGVNSWDTLHMKGVLDYKSSFTGGTWAHKDSTEGNSFFATPLTSLDSIPNFITELDSFDMNDEAKGLYRVTSTINTVPDGEVGLARLNNNWSYNYAISDSIYSKCEYDFANNRPVVNSYVNVSAASQWGPILYIRNGGYSAKKVQFIAMRDVIDDSTYDGQELIVTLSKWTDNDGNGRITDATELDDVATASHIFTLAEVFPITGQLVTMDLSNSVSPGSLIKLDPNTKYWLHADIPGGTAGFAYGADYYSDYSANLSFRHGDGNNLLSGGTMFSGGFANAGSPSLVLHMNTNLTESTNDISFNGNVNIYPNPTSDIVNISVQLNASSSKVTYTLVDITGKTVANSTKNNVISDVYTYNTNKLAAGTYFVNIKTDAGSKQVKFVVTK